MNFIELKKSFASNAQEQAAVVTTTSERVTLTTCRIFRIERCDPRSISRACSDVWPRCLPDRTPTPRHSPRSWTNMNVKSRSSLSVNLYPSTKMILTVLTHFCYATRFYHLGPWSWRLTQRDQGWKNTNLVPRVFLRRATNICSLLYQHSYFLIMIVQMYVLILIYVVIKLIYFFILLYIAQQLILHYSAPSSEQCSPCHWSLQRMRCL